MFDLSTLWLCVPNSSQTGPLSRTFQARLLTRTNDHLSSELLSES